MGARRFRKKTRRRCWGGKTNIDKLRPFLLAGTALLFATAEAGADPAATAPTTATAQADGTAPQTPAADKDDKVEKVTVTARRKGESLQKVPDWVTAVTEKSLDRLGATDVTGLQGAIRTSTSYPAAARRTRPISSSAASANRTRCRPSIPRLASMSTTSITAASAVRSSTCSDLHRVEFCAGPGHALRQEHHRRRDQLSSSAGPIRSSTGNGSVTIGSYNEFQARGTVSGPLSEQFRRKLVRALFTRDGYVTSPSTGQDYNDRNAKAGRLKLAGIRAAR